MEQVWSEWCRDSSNWSDLDTLPFKGFKNSPQQLREEHEDIKERLVAKGYAAKLVALKERRESGSDPNKHPQQTQEEQHSLLKKLKENKEKEKQKEDNLLIKEAWDKQEQDLHELITDEQLITAYEESFATGTAALEEYLPLTSEAKLKLRVLQWI